MINSKLITLLSTFSKNEFRSLGDFVNSPFFNNEKVLKELFNILKKEYPEFSGSNFEKEKVFTKLFPGKKYNDAIFRNTFSKMLTLAEKFLSVKNFTEDTFNKKLFLLKELKSKKQAKLFIKHKNEIDEKLETGSFKNEEYFYKKYLLENLDHEFRLVTSNRMELMDSNTIKAYDYLSSSFISGMLKGNTSIINSNKNIFGKKHKFIFLDEIENFLDKNPAKRDENIYINYYFNSIKLFETDDEKYFFDLKSIIEKDHDSLSMFDRKSIFTILTNYCYYKINKGELNLLPEQFKLYKLNIQKEIYKGEFDFMSHILFMNVVICGLEAGEFEWIENFINAYKNELKEEHRDNTFNFSYALLSYWEKKYDESIKFASRIITDDLSYKHQVKSLYLKIYFDLNEVQPFYSHIDSYKHFVNNDKLLPEENKNLILNYINFSKRLFDLKNNPNNLGYEITKLRKEVNEHKSLINKVWLLSRIK